jgi:hypothetical protein
VAPVELVRLSRRKAQRDIGCTLAHTAWSIAWRYPRTAS